MYIWLTILCAAFILVVHFYSQNKKRKIAIVQKKAIETNEEIKQQIDSITFITPAQDDEILHLIMSGQSLNMSRFAKVHAPLKFLDWQFRESQFLIDTYFSKVEALMSELKMDKDMLDRRTKMSM